MSEFGVLNFDEVAGEDQRLSSKGSGSFLDQFVPVSDLKSGESLTVRILPPVKGGKLFQYNRIHTINGRKINCPRPLVNGKWDRNVPCPICDYYNSLWQQVDRLENEGRKQEAERIKTEARSIKPIERYYYNALVRKMTVDGEVQVNVGPRVLSVGKVLHQMIIRAIVSEDAQERLGDITHVKTGYDFIIRKETRSDYPNYDRSTFAREPSPLGEAELIAHVAENMIDLTKFRSLKELEELEKELAIHRGLIPDDTAAFDVDQFDNKWGEGTTNQTAAKTSVSVQAASESTKEVTKPVVEDVAIESDDFLADLAEFQQEDM